MNGARVTHLEAGTYEVEVHDNSTFHNFHLTGPGVEKSTDIDFKGTTTWLVTFTDGVYRFICDPHAAQMKGEFTVGSAQPPPAATSAAGQVQGPEGDREEAPGREAHDRPGALPRRPRPESPLAQDPRACRVPEPARRSQASRGTRGEARRQSRQTLASPWASL